MGSREAAKGFRDAGELFLRFRVRVESVLAARSVYTGVNVTGAHTPTGKKKCGKK